MRRPIMVNKDSKTLDTKAKKRILTAEGWKRRSLRTKQNNNKKIQTLETDTTVDSKTS